MLVSVALGLPRLPPLTYKSPFPVVVGSRVLVPLGKRIVTGVVVPIEPVAQKDVREIIEVLDDVPLLPDTILELTKRIADYYLCTWGEALFAAIPSGLAPSTVITVEPTRYFSNVELLKIAKKAPLRARLLEFLQQHKHELTTQYIQKQLKTQSISEQLDALHLGGYITITTEVEQQAQPAMVRGITLAEPFTKSDTSLAKVFDELDKRAPKQSLALGQLFLAHKHGKHALTIASLCAEIGATSQVADALIEKGLAIGVMLPKEHPHPTHNLSVGDEASLVPNTEQKQAIELVQLSRFHSYLLDGVTGSGKTLVYMRVMEKVLAKKMNCLMLVPEISLTPQLHDRFKAVFGNSVALLHSRMSMTERVTTWKNIAEGKATVVIGPRSAVLAPLHNIGLIVVDEEHEPSYKQEDPAPRYHGRDVAVMRAAIEQCPVILGSATPSLESLYNVENKGYTLLRLKSRTDGAVLPTVTTVSIPEERTSGAMQGTLSTILVDAVRQRIERNEGTILFLNRRGFASQLTCSDCGATVRCPHCDVNLTWHKKSNQLRCHYCGYIEGVRTVCTTCGGLDLHDQGIGTQRVEEDLLHALQAVPVSGKRDRAPVIARMDSDTMRKQNAHRKLLDRFTRGEVDVIIGTQMIAKGLDLARVTLVGVVLADQGMLQSDFRASERTIQLLYQVAGRAGRAPTLPGQVIIQTLAPFHTVIQTVANNKLQAWQRTEMARRKETLYPPFSRFITIEISGMVESEVEHVANVLDRLVPNNDDALTKYAPVVPSIAWIRNRHRRMIVLKSPKQTDPTGGKARTILTTVLSTYYSRYAKSSVRVTVNVDASGML